MGNKFSSVTVSGYNSSPPADDGTQVASNLVKWSTHKTKIGDPLKTAIEAINTALVSALDTSCRAISSNDTAIASDNAKTLQVTGTTTITLTAAASVGAGYYVDVMNAGTNTVTVSPATSDTINGASKSVKLAPQQAGRFIVNTGLSGYNLSTGNTLIVDATDPSKQVRISAASVTTATTRVATWPDKDGTVAMTSDITTVSAATQAEMEAASSTTVYVSPGRAQYHPGVAKAWALFNGTGTPAYTVSNGFDTGTAIVDGGTGLYTLTFSTPFSSANYAVLLSGDSSGGRANTIGRLVARTTTTVQVQFFDDQATTVDPVSCSILCFGDQ